MLEKEQINSRQLFILVFLVTLGDLVMILPSILTEEAKQDAWISVLLGIVPGLLIVLLFCAIAKRMPQLTFIESLMQVCGKWIGTIFSIFFLGYIIILLAVYTREIGGFIVLHLLPETPEQIINIMFISLVVLAVRLGIRSFTRVAELFFTWFIVVFGLFVILNIPQIEPEYFQPIWQHGFKPVLRGTLPAFTLPYSELIVILMILPSIKEAHNIQKPFILGSLFGGITIAILTGLCVLVLGPEITARNVYPVYSLARKIDIGDVLQRVEVGFTSLWIVTSFIKMTLYFYVFIIGLGQMLKLNKYHTPTLPIMLIITVLSLIITPNITYFRDIVMRYWSFYCLTYGVLLPGVLYVVYLLRHKLKDEK